MALGLYSESPDRKTELWNSVLDTVKDILKDPVNYDAYFGCTTLLRTTEDTAVVSLPNSFVRDIVEEHYADLLLRIIKKQGALQISNITFEVVEAETEDTPAVPAPTEESLRPEKIPHRSSPDTEVINGHQFYEEYTFDTFVVGQSNQMAYHAALSVAEAPGMTTFNPLTIYGKSGLGKTHLIQSIGHFCREESTAEKIYYITAHDFLQRFLDFLHKKRNISAFHKEFDDVDILLIDDIHFLSSKAKTQECFYTIFNKLINMNKQIILTSDRLPQEIPHMHNSLINRFKSGLLVDIKPPSLKTRLSILKKKAKTDNVQLSDEVLEFMASQVTNNIRALEGIFTKVLASSIFSNSELDLSTVRELLDDYRKERVEHVTIEKIQKDVAHFFEISPAQLRAHTRKKNIAEPRSIAMYLSRKLTKQALRTIGLEFGGRDYSTVIYACKKIEKRCETERDFHTLITRIEHQIS
ncbi:MAG: chromosomal replication initiator protein DnaA [Fibrobacterota bacterium]